MLPRLGIGGTALAIQSIFGSQAAVTAPFGVPRLGSAFGPYGILSVFVLAMPVVVFALWALLRRTRFGLQLAALRSRWPQALRLQPHQAIPSSCALGWTLCCSE